MNLTYIPDNFLEGEVLAVILQAFDSSGGSNAQVTIAQVTIAQVTLIELGLECTEVPRYTPIFQSRTRETGWAIAGDETDFRGGWGSYCTYTVLED